MEIDEPVAFLGTQKSYHVFIVFVGRAAIFGIAFCIFGIRLAGKISLDTRSFFSKKGSEQPSIRDQRALLPRTSFSCR